MKPVYSPLNPALEEIRLLYICERSHQSWAPTPTCKLKNVSLKDRPQYEALSYMWGDSSLKTSILIGNDYVSVTESLADALYEMQFHVLGSERLLWVDALCINQDDLNERNHQVRQMEKIYRQAQRVLVWLGTPTPFWFKYDKFANDRKYEKRERDDKHRKAEGSLELISQVAKTISTQSSKDLAWSGPISELAWWESLSSMCELSYWKRLWIVQEVGLASRLTIVHGGCDASWEAFTTLRKWISELQEKRQIPKRIVRHVKLILHSVPAHFDRQRERVEGSSLLALLTNYEISKSQDPRDKVYGLLGLAADVEEDELEVDYSKSLLEVYRDVICYGKIKGLGGDTFDIIRFSQLIQRSLRGPFEVQAGGDQDLDFATGHHDFGKFIHVGGICRGGIRLIHTPSDGKTAANAVTKTRFSALLEYSPFKTMANDRRRKVHLGLQKLENVDQEHILSIKCSPFPESCIDCDDHAVVPAAEDDENKNAQLFLGPQGQFGLATNSARDGDSLFQFLNCDVACIVRKKGGIYRVVSRAVVARGWDEIETPLTESSDASFRYSVLKRPIDLESNCIHLSLDLLTLQMLTCPLPHKKSTRKATSTRRVSR